MTEYNRIAKGKFTSTGAAQVINLPFQPDLVRLFNYTVTAAAAASQNILDAVWDNTMGQGFAIIKGYNATPALIGDLVSTNGISTFSAGQLLQYGAAKQVVTLTKASSGVVTVTSHGYATGDVVVFQGLKQSASTGMQQIAGIPFTITVTDANTFSIPWNTNQSSYTGLSGSPSGATVMKVLYPYLYAPGVAVINALTLASTTTVTTTTANNFVAGQEVAFRIPSQYGTTQLNSLPNTQTPGSPVYGYVVSVTNSTTFVVNINSTGYTAFTNNVAFASTPGLSFPMVVAVGDVNTGGAALTATSNLYPSPLVNAVSTIGSPAISGAFVNNTSQGFIIGAGAGGVLTTGKLCGAANDVIYWQAHLNDIG
jgi:hypothetical protein